VVDEIPYFEPDPLEPFALDDPQVESLLLLAAHRRRMDPSDLLAVLVDCDRRGTNPLCSPS
jgi:hypothetical protein